MSHGVFLRRLPVHVSLSSDVLRSRNILLSQRADGAAANDSSIRPQARLRVFIVEDSLNMQAALRELLASHANFDIVAAVRSEMEATEWLLENRSGWDVASVDLMLADGSGFNIVRRCRGLAPSRPVVVFSEYVTDALRDRCVALGASAAFAKSEFHAYAEFMDKLRDDSVPG